VKTNFSLLKQIAHKSVPFLAAAAIFALLHRACGDFERSHAMQGIPANMLVDELILVDEQSALREGCGVAIFRLSPFTLAEIDHQGLDFFSNSKNGRDNGRYYRYDTWSRTPSNVPDSKVLRGLGCVKVDDSLVTALWGAAKTPGSYLGVGYEYDLLVIPKLGLVVRSFNG
jgi:hypothetical protein